ncbi:hypothetical protein EB796_021496 [Bugula neritina]|uniref:Uncharacterized protein n=1 Tax=Bugula neritina TaxID=10212 RepID=A0A7J7J3H9_BUGNE|nr:hypothetical protein EB796_021496 [Bugula neritina]
MQKGLTQAQHIVRSECECPRYYFDSFNLLSRGAAGGPVLSSTCGDDSHSSTTSRFAESDSSNGKYSMFTADGWMSPLMDESEITIRLQQTVMVCL